MHRVQHLMSHPMMFLVPSTLNILLGAINFLVPIPNCLTILWFRKFSVVPLLISTRSLALPLWLMKVKWVVIPLISDTIIAWESSALIQAVGSKLFKNPFPSGGLVSLSSLLSPVPLSLLLVLPPCSGGPRPLLLPCMRSSLGSHSMVHCCFLPSLGICS